MKRVVLIGAIFFAGAIACLVVAAHGQGVGTGASHDPVDTCLIDGAVGWLSLALLTAHLVAPVTYHFKSNTISDLGAQNYKNAWIMRSGFLGFGALTATAGIWDMVAKKKPWVSMVPLTVYGLSMVATGLFSTAPFEDGVSFSQNEENLRKMY